MFRGYFQPQKVAPLLRKCRRKNSTSTGTLSGNVYTEKYRIPPVLYSTDAAQPEKIDKLEVVLLGQYHNIPQVDKMSTTPRAGEPDEGADGHSRGSIGLSEEVLE